MLDVSRCKGQRSGKITPTSMFNAEQELEDPLGMIDREQTALIYNKDSGLQVHF